MHVRSCGIRRGGGKYYFPFDRKIHTITKEGGLKYELESGFVMGYSSANSLYGGVDGIGFWIESIIRQAPWWEYKRRTRCELKLGRTKGGTTSPVTGKSNSLMCHSERTQTR